MSRISASGISLAENRTFRAFIALYGAMSLLILVLLGALYYGYKKELMLSEHRLAMQLQSENYLPKLRRWMQGDIKVFPKDIAYRTALYDTHGRIVATVLEKPVKELQQQIGLYEGYIHFVILLSSYEMGELYLVLETKDDGLWRKETLRNFVLVGTPLFILLFGVGYTLSKLFLRPMKAAIRLLDAFIKDTTHELNTPVSAILTNIEMIDHGALDEKAARKFNRIAIAARTISTIYDDLTYLVLNHETPRKDETIDLSMLVRERMEYFQTRSRQKQLKVAAHLGEGVTVTMDRTKAERLVDNLLSNAIKYNRVGGSLTVTLAEGMLQVADTGRGISSSKLGRIFERYQRADTSVGGFGIGLNIVGKIAYEYGMRIEVDSTEGVGTTVELQW